MAAPRLVKPDPNRTYNIRIGDSFNNNAEDNIYETIKYEFIPASVDRACVGKMIRKQKHVIIRLKKGNAEDDVVFNGTYEEERQNEAMLIFDSLKQEFILERLHATNRNLHHVREQSVSKKRTLPKKKINAKRRRRRKTKQVVSSSDDDNDSGDDDDE